MKQSYFWVLVALFLSTITVQHMRGDVDNVPSSAPLSQLPAAIGPWTLKEDIPLDQAVLDVLGKGFFLNRVYARDDLSPDTTVPVGLFIGYFPTQRTGQSIHSPQNCLPGAGWTFDSSRVTELVDSTGKHYNVGEYIISNGKVKQDVLYWYRFHGQSIANDYAAKLYMLMGSIRYNRTDAALIRVITPMRPEESQLQAHQRVVAFAQQMNPLLPPFIPN